MYVRTNLKAGENAYELAAAPEEDALAGPYMNKWRTCYRCKGKKDQYGNVSDATCQMCWPMNAQPPV